MKYTHYDILPVFACFLFSAGEALFFIERTGTGAHTILYLNDKLCERESGEASPRL